MPTEFPAALVDLVAHVLGEHAYTADYDFDGDNRWRWTCIGCSEGEDKLAGSAAALGAAQDHQAQAVLAVLADAGHLLPDGAETQYGVRLLFGTARERVYRFDTAHEAHAVADAFGGVPVEQRLVGPWLPVDSTPATGGTDA